MILGYLQENIENYKEEYMNYYSEIKNELINNEITKKVKDYSKNKSDLTTYYNVGKLLSEAGKQYGEGIIKEYSKRLTNELGKGYTSTNLKLMRQFFYFSKSHTVCDQLTWTHYRTILTIKNENERNYYINLVILNNLSVRELKSPMLIKNILRLLVILVILHYQLKI